MQWLWNFPSFLQAVASCLLGNLSKSKLPSLIVLDTNSSSCRKKQKMSLCKILAVSWGYLARLTCACTVLYHLSSLLLPCVKLVRRSKWVHTSFNQGLQNSSNFPQIVMRLTPLMARPRRHICPCQSLYCRQSLSCIFVAQAKLQAHIPKCFHISSANFKNLWYRLIINCPVHFRAFIVRHKHGWNWLGWYNLMKWDFSIRFLFWAW